MTPEVPFWPPHRHLHTEKMHIQKKKIKGKRKKKFHNGYINVLELAVWYMGGGTKTERDRLADFNV